MSTKGVSRRQQDERSLEILSMRKTMSSRKIAEHFGIVESGVGTFCRNVVREDTAHPDPNATIGDYAKAYPWAFKK